MLVATYGDSKDFPAFFTSTSGYKVSLLHTVKYPKKIIKVSFGKGPGFQRTPTKQNLDATLNSNLHELLKSLFELQFNAPIGISQKSH